MGGTAGCGRAQPMKSVPGGHQTSSRERALHVTPDAEVRTGMRGLWQWDKETCGHSSAAVHNNVVFSVIILHRVSPRLVPSVPHSSGDAAVGRCLLAKRLTSS